MGQYIEVCTNPKCGHAKETHFQARLTVRRLDRSTGQWVGTWETHRLNCLGAHCECKFYEAPTW